MRRYVAFVATLLATSAGLVTAGSTAAGAAAHSRLLRPVPVMSVGQSPPVRYLHASPKAKGVFPGDLEQPLRHGRVVSGPTDSATVQTQAGTATAVSATNSFEGQGNADGVAPPDTNGDIGPNNYVQWVNLHLNIYNRSGTLLKSVPGNSIFAGLGSSNPCSYDNDGDPIVQYDQFHDRWVLTQFAFDDFLGMPLSPFGQCVAVSKTSDPTGAYWLYSWDTGAAGNTGTDYFPDYPKLGIMPDGYYMSFNYFSSDLSTFVGSGIMIMDSSKMVVGDPSALALATGPIGAKYGGLLPPDLDGTATPPAGTPATYAAFDSDLTTNTLQFWHASVNWSAGQATFGSAGWAPDATLTVPSYDWNFCGNPSLTCVPQPGTTQQLATLSDRLMYRAAYRYFPSDGHEAMVLTHTVDTDPTSAVRTGVRWYEIHDVSSTPTLYQSGTYSPTAADRWMPSIAMNSAGDIAVGYSVSSATVSPSIRWTGRRANDPLGQMTVAESSITEGSGSQTGVDRWGDYSAMTVDPLDDCTFWYTNEYYPSSSSAGWHTRIGWFRISDCSGSTTPPPAPPATPTGLTATALGGSQAGSVSLSWTPVTGAASYLVERSSNSGTTWASAGTATGASFVDSGLAPVTGYTYRVTAQNSGGSSSPSATASATTSPTGLKVTSIGRTSISLSWSGPTSITYTVFRATGAGTFGAVGSTTGTTFTSSGLTRNTSYSFRVTSSLSAAASNTLTAKTKH